MDSPRNRDLEALLGLGDQSFRKSYYPELQATIAALEREKEKFRTIFNNSVELIGLLATDGTLLEANQTALEAVGAGIDEVRGRPFWDTPWWDGNPEGRSLLRDGIGRAAGGQTVAFETFHRVASGRTMIVQFTITPVREKDGRIALLIPEGRDISVLRDQEEEMRRYNQELETQVAERTARLLAAEKHAALARMVAGLSHEINTPVGIAYTGASHLAVELVSLLDRYRNRTLTESLFQESLEELAQVAKAVEGSLNKAGGLIQNFKLVATDQVSEQRREFGVREYLEELASSLRLVLRERGHRLEIDCPETLRLDSYPGALSQVISNLAMNSLTHGFAGRDGGQVRLEVRREGGRLVFDYRDNGLGLSPEVRRQIFEPFFTTNRSGGSSGLGMTIIYNLVTQVLGGTIAVLEAPGAHFRLELPAALPRA